jgi:hypothetical protein
MQLEQGRPSALGMAGVRFLVALKGIVCLTHSRGSVQTGQENGSEPEFALLDPNVAFGSVPVVRFPARPCCSAIERNRPTPAHRPVNANIRFGAPQLAVVLPWR